MTIQGLPNHTTISRDDLVWTWQLHASSPRDRHDSLGDLSDWLALSGQLGGVFVPQTLTINSHALSGNITLTAADLSLGAVENTALSTWTGSSNLATLGTVAAGVWHATAIADAYIASAGVWNAKANAATTLAGYGITDPIVLTSGSYNDPSWITHLSWAKIAATPTTLSGYGISDAVPSSRTVNGQALSSNVTITSVSGNAGTVTTNANLTGPITSTGNATAVTAGAITNTMLAGSIQASKLVGTDIALTESQITSLVSDLGGKAPLASPTFTGTPAVPTAAPGTNTTQAASTAFVLANAGGGAATALASATTSVNVSAATAPTAGQVLTATNGTHATWQSQAGGGDMTRAVYDSANTGYISGAPGVGGGVGGVLYMYASTTFNGGDISTAASADASGGYIHTAGSGGAGGSIDTSGGATTPGGSITTSGGGGSIDTTGTGSMGFGNSGTRTTVTGTATGDQAISWPNASGTVLLTNGNGSGLSGITAAQVGAFSPLLLANNSTIMTNSNGLVIMATDNAGTSSNIYLQGHDAGNTLADTIGFDSTGKFAINGTAAAVLTFASFTGNASGGDATVSVANYTDVDFTTTDGAALNGTYPATAAALNAMDAQVQSLTKKLQAVEAALAASQLPNH